MNVAILGATGFVGSYIVDALVAAGHTPRALVRPGSENKLRHRERCEIVAGDVDDAAAVGRLMAGADAAIYNIGIIRDFPSKGITFEAMHYEGAVRAIDAAREAGVRRFVLMSANGVRPDGVPYQETKYRAEQYLEASGLDWTIFRPSVVFGDPRGLMEFCTQLTAEMIAPPVPAPLFHDGLLPAGAGEFKLSPVFVGDVARCFVRALEVPETIGKVYPLGGPDTLSWKAIIDTLAEVAGKRKIKLPAPTGVVKAVASLFDRFEWFPVTGDQIRMLMQGNAADGSEAFRTLGITPTRFTPSALAYLERAR